MNHVAATSMGGVRATARSAEPSRGEMLVHCGAALMGSASSDSIDTADDGDVPARLGML